ncbi:MAG: hypothetical protein H8F28_03095 [Fibrella sp.]|nr:hypothetical protein [Armatimonadota bacterium]
MWLKKSTSKQANRYQWSIPFVSVPVLFAIILAGCAPPRAAKPAPKPQRAYVRLQTLTEAHPLTPSLRELDAIAERIRRDSVARPVAPLIRVRFAPLSSQTANITDIQRNTGARNSLRRNAETTLSRYITALRNTNQRIRDEKRSELEGIARARSAEQEAEARASIENETRLAIAARSDTARDTRIRRNAARLNLSNNNIISVARDPETNLPSEKRLEAQIATLREREANPPPTDEEPFLTSDEARMTKLLRDLEAQLAKIRAANERDTTFNNGLIADAIATIRSDNAIWVEEQLAKLPMRDQSRSELAAIRSELAILLLNLQQTERFTRSSVSKISDRGSSSLSAIPSVVTSSPLTGDLSRRLSAERAAIRTTIQRDVLAAVRDAGLSHNIEPVFSSASNTPNRTADFQRWIFGNVDAITLSKQSAP